MPHPFPVYFSSPKRKRNEKKNKLGVHCKRAIAPGLEHWLGGNRWLKSEDQGSAPVTQYGFVLCSDTNSRTQE